MTFSYRRGQNSSISDILPNWTAKIWHFLAKNVVNNATFFYCNANILNFPLKHRMTNLQTNNKVTSLKNFLSKKNPNKLLIFVPWRGRYRLTQRFSALKKNIENNTTRTATGHLLVNKGKTIGAAYTLHWPSLWEHWCSLGIWHMNPFSILVQTKMIHIFSFFGNLTKVSKR